MNNMSLKFFCITYEIVEKTEKNLLEKIELFLEQNVVQEYFGIC